MSVTSFTVVTWSRSDNVVDRPPRASYCQGDRLELGGLLGVLGCLRMTA